MLPKTLPNRVHPLKGFVYQKKIVEDLTQPAGYRIDVWLRARTNGQGACSCCGRRGLTYDTLGERRFDFVPLWGVAVVLVPALRRIDCRYVVKVGRLPWCVPGGKRHARIALQVFLARWSSRLSWKQVSDIFAVNRGKWYIAR